MTSEVETDTGDEERWAEAQSMLAGTPPTQAQQRARRRRNRLLVILGGLLVAAVVAGLLTALLLPHHRHRSSHLTGWPVTTGLLITGCGLIVEIVAFVVLSRRGYWRRAWSGPLMVLTWRQRRLLVKQVRGQRPLDPARLRLTRYMAEWLDEQMRLTLPIFIGVALINFGNVLQARDAFHYVFVASWVAFLLLVLVLWGRQRRKARRFLEEHPASEN